VAEGLSDDEALTLVTRTLNYYIREARFKTRSARFMERYGVEALKKAVLG
jgi:NAD(P)H-nitrite reductase large subunit